MFSFFVLLLHFLSRVLGFAFKIFCSNIFLFYFFKLIFWNGNIRQIMYVFSFPSTPVSSTFMSVIPSKSIDSKNDLLLWLYFWIFSWEAIMFQLFAISMLAFSMYIVIIYFPVYDVINFEINLVFLVKTFCYMTKKA